eukprot:superscaffoldBa00009342_g24031
MASSSSLLSEEQFLCPICLDMFTQPVSTPCGHNFCMSCISCYWNDIPVCRCPVCKETFETRPDLKVNTFISELESQFMSLQVTDAHIWSLDQQQAGSGDTDDVLLCDVCASLRHVSHSVAPVQQAYKERKALVGDTEVKVQQMIKERLQKVQDMKASVEQSKTDTRDVIESSVRDLTALVSEIQKVKEELVKVIEEKQKAAEEQADGFISGMVREVVDLEITAVNLRDLKQMDDQVRFLQSFPVTSLLPHTMDLSTFSFDRHLGIQHIRKSLSKSVSQLRVLLDKMNTEINQSSEGADVSDDTELRHMQRFEVDVRLDPDTAHPLLILSDDGKQVRYNEGLWLNQNLNPNMFTVHLAVLGLRGFSSCKYYFEVFVGKKTEWCLGMATASIQKRGALIRGPHSGLWAIWFLGNKFEDFSSPNEPVHFGKVEKVGVFVDCDG